MKANIVITLDGQIQIVTQEGTFEAGKAKLEAIISALGQNFNLESVGKIEQHRHDEPGKIQAGHVHSH